MAVAATFYELAKRVNSTKRPGVGTAVMNANILLKEGCSAQAPVVGIKWDGSSNPSRYNGCHISAFGRYYWVTDWTYEDRIWWATCKTDVLATAKTEIGASSKYVLRAASEYDPNITDQKYFPILPCRVQSHLITGFSWATDFSNGRFVVGIIGQGNNFTQSGVGYYVLTGSGIQGLYNACFTETQNLWANSSANPPSSTEAALMILGYNFMKSIQNPAQFINSICWVPFIPSTSGTEEIILGAVHTGTYGHPLSDPIHTDTFYITLPFNDNGADPWMYMAPYAQYRLHLPPFPDVDLDASKIYNKTIYGTIYTDVTSGISQMEIGVGSSTEILTVGGNVGIPISFAGGMTDYFGAVKSAISGAAGIAGGVVTGNVVGAISSGLSGVGGVIESLQPKATQGGYSGGLAAIRATKHVTRTLYTVPDMDISEQGRPLCTFKTLNTLSGYIMCADGDINAALTDGELKEIEAFLTGGFFYE